MPVKAPGPDWQNKKKHDKENSVSDLAWIQKKSNKLKFTGENNAKGQKIDHKELIQYLKAYVRQWY
jgi:hypothetical protein